MKQKKKATAILALFLVATLYCSTTTLAYATNTGETTLYSPTEYNPDKDNIIDEQKDKLLKYGLPPEINEDKIPQARTGSGGTVDEGPDEDPKQPNEDPEPPIEPDDFESPDEPDLPVYPMERVEFPPEEPEEEPEVPVEPVTPAEPEPQPEPAPQPEPEPEPQPEPQPAPQPEPAPTLPQTSQLWWPVGLVFILGFAMVLAGLVEMRKSRRHEDSDR